MKNYRLSEEIGRVDAAFIEEVFEYGKNERRTIMSKKVLAIALAAALVITVGVTAVAASWSGLIKLDEYFVGCEETFNVPEKMPKAEISIVGNDLVTTVPEPEPFEPGDARVTSVVATNHGLFCTIEINIAGLGVPDELPEEALDNHGFIIGDIRVFQEVDGSKERYPWSGHVSTEKNGDTVDVVISAECASSRPEGKMIFEIENIAYLKYEGDDKVDVPVYEGIFEAVLNPEDYEVLESRYSTNIPEIMGVPFSAELCANGLFLTVDGSEDVDIVEWAESDLGKKAEQVTYEMSHSEICLITKDGRKFSGLLGSFDYDGENFIGGGGSGLKGLYLSFVTLINTDEIASVTVDGVEFTF